MSSLSPEPGVAAAVSRILQKADRGTAVTRNSAFVYRLSQEDQYRAQLALLLRACCPENRVELSCADLKNILSNDLPTQGMFLVLRNGATLSLREKSDATPARISSHVYDPGIILEIGHSSINNYSSLSPSGIREIHYRLPFPAEARWKLESYDHLERNLVTKLISQTGELVLELGFSFSKDATISLFPRRSSQQELHYGLWRLISDKSGLLFCRELSLSSGKANEGPPFFQARFDDGKTIALGALDQVDGVPKINVTVNFFGGKPTAASIKCICCKLDVRDEVGAPIDDLGAERLKFVSIQAGMEQALALADCLKALELMTKNGWMK